MSGRAVPCQHIAKRRHFDRVAELMVDVLAATSASAAASGGASKAKYSIADGVAEKTQSAANELLDANPLYPGLDIS